VEQYDCNIATTIAAPINFSARLEEEAKKRRLHIICTWTGVVLIVVVSSIAGGLAFIFFSGVMESFQAIAPAGVLLGPTPSPTVLRSPIPRNIDSIPTALMHFLVGTLWVSSSNDLHGNHPGDNFGITIAIFKNR
jgi:hypothetical protein